MAREKFNQIWTPEILRDYAWLIKKCDAEFDGGKSCEQIVIECVKFGVPAGIVITALHESGILLINYGIDLVGLLKRKGLIPMG